MRSREQGAKGEGGGKREVPGRETVWAYTCAHTWLQGRDRGRQREGGGDGQGEGGTGGEAEVEAEAEG